MKHRFIKSFTTVTPLSKALAFYLFILLPVLAFFYGVHYAMSISQVMPVSSSVVTVLPTETPTPIHWNTYVNLNYGFSFQYPSSLSLICCEVGGPLSETSQRVLSFADKQTASSEGKPFDGLGVYIDPNPSKLSFDAYVNREYASFYRGYPRFSGNTDSYDRTLKMTPLTIGSYSAVSIQGQFDYPYENIYVPFPDNQRVLILAKLLKNSYSDFSIVSKKMISSLQFLSPAKVQSYDTQYRTIDANAPGSMLLPLGVVFDSSSSALLDKQ